MTMVRGISIPIPKPMLCYKISDTSSEHEFMQIFDDIPLNIRH